MPCFSIQPEIENVLRKIQRNWFTTSDSDYSSNHHRNTCKKSQCNSSQQKQWFAHLMMIIPSSLALLLESCTTTIERKKGFTYTHYWYRWSSTSTQAESQQHSREHWSLWTQIKQSLCQDGVSSLNFKHLKSGKSVHVPW